MDEALLASESYIRSEYLSRLGREILNGIESLEDGQRPVWQWQDAELRNVDGPEDAQGALIADPETGICLFLQRYGLETRVREHLARALRIRGQLLPSRETSATDTDSFGEWRVGLHWLVDAADFPHWVEEIADLRQETAHFEEIPVDAVVNWYGNWEISCKEHKFPRLLLRVREILGKGAIDESMNWANADAVIEDKIREIPEKTRTDIQRRFADQLVETLEGINKEKGQIELPELDASQALTEIRIENFRNIEELHLHLQGKTELVSSNVFQGPNGSGKSSVFEAISIAVTRVSNRYLEFLEDPNYPGRKHLLSSAPSQPASLLKRASNCINRCLENRKCRRLITGL